MSNIASVIPPVTSQSVSDLLSTGATASQQFATAQAENTQAAGNQLEAGEYTNAQQTADQNAQLALVSSGVQQAQEGRTIASTIGSQKAQVAAAGLGTGGSAAYLLRDSTQQGRLAEQMIGLQGDIASGGYAAQASASGAEAQAATAASQSALTLAQQASAAGTISQSNALNTAMELTDQATAELTPAGIQQQLASNPTAVSYNAQTGVQTATINGVTMTYNPATGQTTHVTSRVPGETAAQAAGQTEAGVVAQATNQIKSISATNPEGSVLPNAV